MDLEGILTHKFGFEASFFIVKSSRVGEKFSDEEKKSARGHEAISLYFSSSSPPPPQ